MHPLGILPFDTNAIGQVLAPVPSASREYVLGYLTELGATVALREPHYIDRHYLDDFSDYYARSFAPPTASCERFHFFRDLSAEDMLALLSQAYEGDAQRRAEIELQLQEAYLGFVVKRPLPGASFGRTVLRTYPIDGRRHYEVVRPYIVNIGGLRLAVKGLAYQQQDGGAAVCASTSLWSALQRVAHVAGHRTPTPSMITKAAESPFAASHGLNEMQMAHALSRLGYAAELFAPEENRGLFLAQVVSCLQSQLPVILLITRKIATGVGQRDVGHAVTVTGFSEPADPADVHLGVENIPTIRMRAAAVRTVYVHDDNLGFHAHYELRLSEEKDEKGNPILALYRGRTNKPPVSWWTPDEWVVRLALVPKPPKLRLSVDRLLHSLVQLRRLVEALLPGIQFDYSTRFMSGVDYKRLVLDMPVDRKAIGGFLTSIGLPRHVGVISAFDGTQKRLDFVVDVSQVESIHGIPSLHALVAPGIPNGSLAALNVARFAMPRQIPFLLAPPNPPPSPPAVALLPAEAAKLPQPPTTEQQLTDGGSASRDSASGDGDGDNQQPE
ncbi:MAG TPA: hypothetical protein VHB79_30555 [Polyangiaceae bacterium]|nr:hypothetical protein [Polyangiaceae bacterium]